MLSLGELYYYDKLLEENTQFADILGVEYDDTLRALSDIEKISTIKDRFIEYYNSQLKESGLYSVERVFNAITDISLSAMHVDIDADTSSPVLAMTQALFVWMQEGQKVKQLGALLREFELISSSSLPAYSLYYGVHVLYYLALKLAFLESDSSTDAIVADNAFISSDEFSLTQKDIMIAWCPPSLRPLFESNGIEAMHDHHDPYKLINYLEGRIQRDEALKAVLILGIDQHDIDIVRRHFKSSSLLFCVIPESVSITKNSFAEIALKTIGLSEAVIRDEVSTLSKL